MKISIITVCYNSKTTIEQTIQSVIKQDYEQKEYIIIDGNSSDGTVDIIRKYEKDIDFWCSEPDAGIYDAMNKGLLYATGDVIAFLNSDDWYEPDILERVEKWFEKNEIDCLAGQVNSIMYNRIVERKFLPHTEEDIHLYMIYMHPAMFVRKEVFEHIGSFDTRYKIAADYDFVLRAHNAGYRFLETTDVFSNFRRDGVSAVQSYQCMRETKEIALKNIGEHGEALREKICQRMNLDAAYDNTLINLVCKRNPDYVKDFFGNSENIYVWGTGDVGHQCLDFLVKAGVQIKGFVDTYKKQQWFRGYQVLFPEQLPKSAFVCIGVEKYQDEITHQLQEMGFDNRNFISYLDVVSAMLAYGKNKYCDEVR